MQWFEARDTTRGTHVAALRFSWSGADVRGIAAAQDELQRIGADPDAFLEPLRPERMLIKLLRVLWASPCSLLGLLAGLAAIAVGGSARRVGRTLEFALIDTNVRPDSLLARSPFVAITFGHVIIGLSHARLAEVRGHELVHVRQYELLGPLFLLAYPCASLLAAVRGGCPYRDNYFEIQAYRRADIDLPSLPSPEMPRNRRITRRAAQ